nr:metacaspase-9-like [Coffea arabica]
MIERAKGGDILLFFFRGHGTFQDFWEGSDSKREEAIVPCDCNLSVDFLDMVNHMPERADFVLVADSCNSGGGLVDQLKEQVGPGLLPDVCYSPKSNDTSLVAKVMPITEIMQHLKPLTGLNSPDVRAHLLNVFGTDASLKF